MLQFDDIEEIPEYNITEWDVRYMNIADHMSEGSKCAAKGVGCVIVKNQSIISSGVNGTPSGYTNCNEKFYKENDIWHDKENEYESDENLHRFWSMNYEIHAEINAISNLTKNGISSYGTSLYTSYSPCFNCAKSIVASGISKVFYRRDFDNLPLVENYLNENNVVLIKIVKKEAD